MLPVGVLMCETGFFLLDAGAFSFHICLNMLFHVWPIKSVSSEAQDSFCLYTTHIIMEVFQDHRLVLVRQN